MRTKALLLGAMIGAASLATSMAQVYSVNIVGYVNVTIPHGFSLIANPLNATGGNTIGNVIPVPPNGCTIYKFRNATGDYLMNIFDPDWQEWGTPGMSCNPGEGLFIWNAGSAFTWTFVGEVPTGTQTLNTVHGFQAISSIIPQSGKLTADLGYVPTPNAPSDTVYKYRNDTGMYDMYIYDPDWAEWSIDPMINPGEGFFLLRGDSGWAWTRTFNVGP